MFRKRFFTFLLILNFLMMGTAWAGSYDLKTITPQIQKAIDNRQARYDELRGLKAQGQVGENNKGYVEILGNASVLAVSLAQAENLDRRTIYSAIVEQNNLGTDGIEQVESVFAEVQREKAAPGDSIQLPSGEWGKKGSAA